MESSQRDGTWLALGVAAGLVAIGSARKTGSLATVQQLRHALQRAPRGSMKVSGRGLKQLLGTGQRLAHAPKYARLFLSMEPRDVPDDLLVATLLAGATRQDPVSAAAQLLRSVRGKLARVAHALPQGLEDDVTVPGKARLTAASELYRRAEYRGAARGVIDIRSPEELVRLLKSMSLGPYEILSAIYLDTRHKVLGTRVLSKGTTRFTIVDPSQVYRPAIQLGASKVILAHHHPSGDPTPSSADYTVTRDVAKAGQVLRIPLLDHIVLSGDSDKFTSLADEGEVPHSPSGPFTLRG